jgi:pSer/pThr/pTyr-binding forkhead associated (FHA) protein
MFRVMRPFAIGIITTWRTGNLLKSASKRALRAGLSVIFNYDGLSGFKGAAARREEMLAKDKGKLVPVGGGDSIPLIRDVLTMGRRESCDICLQFPNVSGRHCELVFKDGYWTVRDLGSTNGIKVNGERVQSKILHPGDTITIAKRSYTIEYTQTISKQALAKIMADAGEIMDQPLLQKAGLAKPEDQHFGKKPSKPWLNEEDEEEDDDDDDELI